MLYDDRITKKAGRTAHINLICRNHPKLHWHTKNISHIGARSIFFSGEDGKKNHHGMMISRSQAFKLLEKGDLLQNGELVKDTDEKRAELSAYFDKVEQEYGFECACPITDLRLDPKYDDMPDVEMES